MNSQVLSVKVRSLIILLLLTRYTLAEDPTVAQQFSLHAKPPTAYQEYNLKVKDGSLLDFGRELRELRTLRGFPLLYENYDSLVEDGIEGGIEVYSKHKVNLNLQDAPLWRAIAAICNQMDMGLDHSAGGYLELDDFANTFDYWASVGPMLLTFRMQQSDELRIESFANPADAKVNNPLQIAIYALPGEARQAVIHLREVSLISDKNTPHQIPVKESSEPGKWYSKQPLPFRPSKIAGIEGKIFALVAKQLLTLKFSPGKQTYINGSNGLKITVTDVEESPALDIDGTKFEPHKKNGTVYYLRVEMEWRNGLSPRKWQQVEKYFAAFPSEDIMLKQAKQFQKLLEDEVSYTFINNRNCSPSSEAGQEFNLWAPGQVKLATACNCVVAKSQGLLVLHLFSDVESEIRTCHELQIAKDGLLIDSFMAKRSVINDRHLKVELVE